MHLPNGRDSSHAGAKHSSWRQLLRGAAALAKLPLERFSVAPMMDYTDRHFRHLFRLLSKESVLYTEMVTANTLVDDAGAPQTRQGRPLAGARRRPRQDRFYSSAARHQKCSARPRTLAIKHHDYAGVNSELRLPVGARRGRRVFWGGAHARPRSSSELC